MMLYQEKAVSEIRIGEVFWNTHELIPVLRVCIGFDMDNKRVVYLYAFQGFEILFRRLTPNHTIRTLKI